MVRNTSPIIETRPVSISAYGILSSAAEVIVDESEDWISGFMYDTLDGSVQSVNSSISGVHPGVEEVIVDNEGLPAYRWYYPFDVKTTIKTSTMGTTPANVLQQASSALDVVLQKNIESEFWNGAIAQQLDESSGNRYLASPEAIDLTPASLSGGVRPKHAQAILEAALGNTTVGSKGVLHAPRDVASTLRLSAAGDALMTILGNYVVAGSGYIGNSPNGVVTEENKAWMYATGPVTVRVGKLHVTPEEVGQAVDSTNNTINYYVDRPVAVTWATSKLYSVLVDLSLDLA